MFSALRITAKDIVVNEIFRRIYISPRVKSRTFLSQAYCCQEVWENRLNSPLLKKINLDELYQELDQRFQKSGHISPVDVDIFANSVNDSGYTDELIDLVHKLRLSSATTSTLNSTPHAVIRFLIDNEKWNELLNILDDRLNFGVFLDYYLANLLLDIFWKKKDFLAGVRVCGQLMLQEEFDHPLTSSLCLLHCYNYLLDPKGWPEYKTEKEPEEEVKIRVKYLRNPYDDDHFDLKDGNKIIGKTLINLTKKHDSPLNASFNVLGQILFGRRDRAESIVKECSKNNISLYQEVLNLIPEKENMEFLNGLKVQQADVNNELKIMVEKAQQTTSERDIANQCTSYNLWDNQRIEALEEQKRRMLTDKRLSNIEDLKKALKEKETKLWFFENEEKIELAIEAKKVFYPKRWFGKKKKPRKIDEGYVPPEIQTKFS